LIGESANTILKDASAEMILKKAPSVSAIKTSAGYFVPLDIDVVLLITPKRKKKRFQEHIKVLMDMPQFWRIWVKKDI